jgi:hypothetical protein
VIGRGKALQLLWTRWTPVLLLLLLQYRTLPLVEFLKVCWTLPHLPHLWTQTSLV